MHIDFMKHTTVIFHLSSVLNMSFFIMLWNLNYHTVIDSTKDDTKEFLRILELMRRLPNITIDKIAEETGVSRRQTVRYINELTESGFIKREGGRKNGYWQIIKQ